MAGSKGASGRAHVKTVARSNRASTGKVGSKAAPVRAGRAAAPKPSSRAARALLDIHAESDRINADLATLLARLDG